MSAEEKSFGLYSHWTSLSDSEGEEKLSRHSDAYTEMDCDGGDDWWFETSSSSTYLSAKEKSLLRRKAWKSISGDLLDMSLLHTCGAYDLSCAHCKKRGKDMVRCRDCDGPTKSCQIRFCRQCFLQYHSDANQHHVPEMFIENRWRYVKLTDTSYRLVVNPTKTAIVQRSLPTDCSTGCNASPQPRECLVYYLNPPRPESSFLLKYKSCTCHIASTLVGLGVMPLSPSLPSVGIALDTMHTLFQLRYGPAAVEFNGLLHLLVGPDRDAHRDVRNLFSEAFIVFSDLFINSARNMNHLAVDLPTNVQCLPCRERSYASEPLVGVAIDLQYLGRLAISDDSFEAGVDDHCSGTLLSETQIKSLHTTVTAEKEKVDSKGTKNRLPPLSKSGCERHFKASDSLNGKTHHNLKERGIVAAVCTEEVCLHAFESVRHEAFIHIAMMVWLLTQGLGGTPAKAKYGILVLFYDAACKIAAYLHHYFPAVMLIIKFFGVGLFHIWAHIPKCQRVFSGIRTTLAGLSDGELVERLFAVTAKFRTSMKYTRKFVWWNTIKQVIEETNHAKMESYVDFSIGKILSSKAAIVSKQAEYTAQLKAFMASKEGEGISSDQVDRYFSDDTTFREKHPDIPSLTPLVEYGDLVLDFYNKQTLLLECAHTSAKSVTLRDTVNSLTKKLLKFERKPPAELLPFLSDGRPTPLQPDPWYEFVMAWGHDKLRYIAWQILIQRRQIMSQREEKKSFHLHVSPRSLPKKQANNTQYQKNIKKAQGMLIKQCQIWNSVLEQVRELDLPSIETTFACAPIDIPALNRDTSALLRSMGREFAQLDDSIPRHLLQYPLLKPMFDLRRDIERTKADIAIRDKNLDLMIAARARDVKAIQRAMIAFQPPIDCKTFRPRLVQAKYAFLLSQLEHLQLTAAREQTSITSYRSRSNLVPKTVVDPKRKRKRSDSVVASSSSTISSRSTK